MCSALQAKTSQEKPEPSRWGGGRCISAAPEVGQLVMPHPMTSYTKKCMELPTNKDIKEAGRGQPSDDGNSVYQFSYLQS